MASWSLRCSFPKWLGKQQNTPRCFYTSRHSFEEINHHTMKHNAGFLGDITITQITHIFPVHTHLTVSSSITSCCWGVHNSMKPILPTQNNISKVQLNKADFVIQFKRKMQATKYAASHRLVRFSSRLIFWRFPLSERKSIKGLVMKVKTVSEQILPGLHSF